MASIGSISTFRTRMMPSLAILRHDLRTLGASWLVRLWLAASAVVTLLIASGNWGGFQTAPLIAMLLLPYLVFPWFLVVIVLGVSPVSGSRTESLADGILSRPVARYEYLLASWAARVVVVLGVYLMVIVPAILILARAERPVPDDTVTSYGMLAAVSVVGLVLTLQVSLGFLLGTLLRRPLLAVVVLIFLWFPINFILNTFSLEEFSPISLNQAIPTLLRQPWREAEADSQDVEGDLAVKAVADYTAQFMSVFSGGAEKPAEQPAEGESTFFNRDEFEDLSLTWVLLGYGIPTLLSVALATLCFCLRDL